MIFIFGFFPEFICDVAANRNVGGGPFESMSRLLKAEQPTSQLSDSAGTKALTLFDRFAAWFFRRIENVIPDVDSFNWTQFVSEGFNINGRVPRCEPPGHVRIPASVGHPGVLSDEDARGGRLNRGQETGHRSQNERFCIGI